MKDPTNPVTYAEHPEMVCRSTGWRPLVQMVGKVIETFIYSQIYIGIGDKILNPKLKEEMNE